MDIPLKDMALCVGVDVGVVVGEADGIIVEGALVGECKEGTHQYIESV